MQVRLQWGDKDVLAEYVIDESWAVSGDFPVDTVKDLIVTFNDSNGAITVGSFEQTFRTGRDATETIRISANQFDTERCDDDSDGISNIDELIAGTNSGGGDVPEPVQASLELMPVKTFRISWEPSVDAEFYRVLENPDGVSGFTDVSGELAASTEEYDFVVALYARVNAEYLVQACNESGCAVGEDSAATGINGDQSDNSISGAGAAYVFLRSSGEWQQKAYIKSNDTSISNLFGAAVSVSGGGNTVLIGSPTSESNSRRGLIYLY